MFKRGMSKFGRRGISPLIATVLLVAFAVAIGTMIMSWVPGNATNVGDCADTKMEVQEINGKSLFCYDMLEGKINVMIKNTGQTDINRMKMRIIASDFSTEDVDIPDSLVKSSDIKTMNINYVRSGKFRVEIMPVITSAGKEKTCADKYVFIDDIGPCN